MKFKLKINPRKNCRKILVLLIFTSFTMSALISFRAWANSWCCAKSAVHTLWIAKCRLTILSHVTFWTLTDFIMIAPSAVRALFIAFWIRSFYMNYQKNSLEIKMNDRSWCWSPKGFTEQFSDFIHKNFMPKMSVETACVWKFWKNLTANT